MLTHIHNSYIYTVGHTHLNLYTLAYVHTQIQRLTPFTYVCMHTIFLRSQKHTILPRSELAAHGRSVSMHRHLDSHVKSRDPPLEDMQTHGHICPLRIRVHSNKQKTTSTELQGSENFYPLCSHLASGSNLHVPVFTCVRTYMQTGSLAHPPAVHHSSIESWDASWYP